MKDNLSTIKYSIQDKKFKYHMIKSQLKKDSLISKKTHPLKEVENYKKKLMNKKLLENYNADYYVLKKTIKVGGLMAYNLYSGKIKKEFEINYPIVINKSDDMIKQEFKIKNIFSIDSILHNNVNIGAYKLKKISKLEINFILNINGVVTAIEVKSGNNKQAKSLNSIIDNYKSVKRYIKLEYNTNIYVDDKNIEHYPLYMIMFI